MTQGQSVTWYTELNPRPNFPTFSALFFTEGDSGEKRDSGDWEDLFRRWYSEASAQCYRGQSSSSFNVPPSFQTSDLPAARRWFQEAKEDLEAAKSNIASGHYNYAAYACRMAIERCVKSVELTCKNVFTRTHDVPQIIFSLPDSDVKDGLRMGWRDLPSIFQVYSDIMYRGLNCPSGPRSSDFFRNQTGAIDSGLEVAGKLISLAEIHLDAQ